MMSMTIEEKYAKLGVDNAPGQEVRQSGAAEALIGEPIEGVRVDFSHGDVNAFQPIPGSIELLDAGFREGAAQAYTEYRGRRSLREELAAKLADFTGAPVDAEKELIVTPGTQGALFLAMGACIAAGDRVAIVEPDYFANRKLVTFFDGELVPIRMDYLGAKSGTGLDYDALEAAFRSGVKLFLFSNPNNPTGAIYPEEELRRIGTLAARYGVKVICDELYSRQIFDGRAFAHLRALNLMDPDDLITIMGPSKTESLSGFRLGAAFGSPTMIQRMEKLQAIVSLRAAGYCQAALSCWFSEPEGWMEERVKAHQAIRDDMVEGFGRIEGCALRPTEGGSYLFVRLPELKVTLKQFVTALRVQANVVVTPGTEFGPYPDCFRINFSQDRKAANDAVRRIAQMVERYRL